MTPTSDGEATSPAHTSSTTGRRIEPVDRWRHAVLRAPIAWTATVPEGVDP